MAVRETATALLEHETLSGVALDAVLSTVAPMPIEERRNGNADGRDAGQSRGPSQEHPRGGGE